MPRRKPANKQKENDRMVDIIYDKALALFLKEGYDNTPMSRIAAVLGISKAGLYYYCSSKENLLYRIHKSQLDRQLIPLMEEAEKIADPKERLRFFLRKYAIELATYPGPRVLMHEVHRLDKRHYREINAIYKRAFELVRGAVKELQKKGEARKLKDSFVAFMAIGMSCWTTYWFDYTRPSMAGKLADTLVEVFFRGIEK